MFDLEDTRNQADRLLAQHNHYRRQFRAERRALKEAKKRVQNIELAQQLVQQIAEQIQNKAHKRIASVVTKCLESVMEQPYEFRILFERKRGKTEGKLRFYKEDVELDPKEEVEGSMIDVAAFALRLAKLVLSHPQRRKVVFLDEPFRFLSVENQLKMHKLILTLAKELGIQFVLTSHSEALRIGKVVQL